VFGVFAFGFAEFHQFQLAFHRFGLVAAVIDAFATRALHFHIRFLFCRHIIALMIYDLRFMIYEFEFILKS
jgi:hypothetical protein